MSDIYLSRCRCGGNGLFVTEETNTRVFAQCMLCGIRTPSRGAKLDVAAKREVADIWNCGAEQWPRWIKPTAERDRYEENDRVSWTTGEGGSWEHWISKVNDNSWEPGVSGWTLVGPAPNKGVTP